MKKIKNFIEAHKHSKCPGSYRKGVVFDSSGTICRMFINFTTSKLDKYAENYDTIFYAGRGKKDRNKYFVENTDKNPENLKMKKNTTAFPIYIKNKNGYFYLGHFAIDLVRKKSNIIQIWDLFARKYNIFKKIQKKYYILYGGYYKWL